MINSQIFNVFPVLESERLRFRKFLIADAPEIFDIRSNKKVMEFMDSDFHKNVKESELFIQKNFDIYHQQKGIFWAIEEKSTQKFVGDFAFWNIDSKNLRGEIGYGLKPEFWDMGYMKESMQTLIQFGFSEINLHSVEANINPNNINSRKTLEKVGFKKEAYFRENYYHDGQFLDSEIYSLLEKDFNQLSR